MITKPDLAKTYSEYSVSELLEVIENKHNYTDVAVSVALEEISHRNISEKEIALHKKKQIDSLKQRIKRNYVDRLNPWQKHLFYFMWIPLLTLPLRKNFTEEGYLMKLRQARYFSLLGFISLITAASLNMEFKLAITSFWLILILEFGVTLMLDGVFNPVYIEIEPED